MTRTNIAWLSSALVLVAAFSSCKSEPKAPDVQSVQAEALDISLPDLRIKTEPPSPLRTRLVATSVPKFDSFKVPVQAKFSEIDGDDVRYVINASLSELVEFYRLEGFAVTYNPSGATVRAGDGRLALMLPTGSRQVELIFLNSAAQPEDTTGEKPVPIPPEAVKQLEKEMAKEKGYLD